MRRLEREVRRRDYVPKVFGGDYNFNWVRRDDPTYPKRYDYTSHFLSNGYFDERSFHQDLTIDYILIRKRDGLEFEHKGRIRSNGSDHDPIVVKMSAN